MKRLALVCVATLSTIGCYGSSLPQMPAPPLEAGANLERWEYFCTPIHQTQDMAALLNNAGAHGWELVGSGMESGDTVWCFKRSLGGGAPTVLTPVLQGAPPP